MKSMLHNKSIPYKTQAGKMVLARKNLTYKMQGFYYVILCKPTDSLPS